MWLFTLDFMFRSVFFCFIHAGYTTFFQGGAGTGAKSSDSTGEGQGTPWISRQLIAGMLQLNGVKNKN